MTFEDLESWQQARQLAASVTYVIEDNYPKLATEAVEPRKKAIGAGQLVGGLLRSTESRKTRILSLLTPLFALPSPLSSLLSPCPEERHRHSS